MSDALILVPARGGSKGIPDKNIKELDGKPLIYYTLEVAKKLEDLGTICISTDSNNIANVAETWGLNIPFMRPPELASDTSSTYDVILHALDFYAQREIFFDKVILLQPTSPFRNAAHVREALELFKTSTDMVASVVETDANPYYVLFEEDDKGFLTKSKKGDFSRRQDCPIVYEMNGALFIYSVSSIRENNSSNFKRIKKYVMDKKSSIDIDSYFDWEIAECLMKKNKNY